MLMAMSKRDCCASFPTSMVLPYSLLSISFVFLFAAQRGSASLCYNYLFVRTWGSGSVAQGTIDERGNVHLLQFLQRIF